VPQKTSRFLKYKHLEKQTLSDLLELLPLLLVSIKDLFLFINISIHTKKLDFSQSICI